MGGLYPNDASWLDSAGRLLLVALFIILGVRNLSAFQREDHIKRLGFARCPMPAAAFWAGIVLEFVGVALVLTNWHPAIGVVCLLLFTVMASCLMHRFWETDDAGKRIGMQNGLCANLAVVGGLLLLLHNVR